MNIKKIKATIDYKSLAKMLSKEKEYMYIVKNKYQEKEFKKLYNRYLVKIKDQLINPVILKEFIYEDIPDDLKIKFVFNITTFPVLVIKEKDKAINVLVGIKDI